MVWVEDLDLSAEDGVIRSITKINTRKFEVRDIPEAEQLVSLIGEERGWSVDGIMFSGANISNRRQKLKNFSHQGGLVFFNASDKIRNLMGYGKITNLNWEYGIKDQYAYSFDFAEVPAVGRAYVVSGQNGISGIYIADVENQRRYRDILSPFWGNFNCVYSSGSRSIQFDYMIVNKNQNTYSGIADDDQSSFWSKT